MAALEGWGKLVDARSHWVQRVEGAIVTLREGLKLENAVGVTLQRWGVRLGFAEYRIGVDQPMADEDWYRALLVIRQRVLRSDATPDTLISIANDYDDLFGGDGVIYYEHDAATVIVQFSALPFAALGCGHRLLNGMQSPGVRLILIARPETDYYGFAGDPDALGLDEPGDPSGGAWSEAAQ